MSKLTFKNITRYKDYSQNEYTKKKREYESPVHVGGTILELSKFNMYDVFYNIPQPSLKDLQFHYKDTDSFGLSFSEGNVNNEHMDLSNLEPRSGFPDPSIKSNNKVPSKFKHEFGNRIMEEFMACHQRHIALKITQIKLKRMEYRIVTMLNLKSFVMH